MNLTLGISLITVLTFSHALYAKPPKGNGPPPEAIEACQNLNEGDSVSFETHRGDTLQGTCQMIEDQLAAVPNNHRKKSRK